MTRDERYLQAMAEFGPALGRLQIARLDALKAE
jgi:hypothetical protein